MVYANNIIRIILEQKLYSWRVNNKFSLNKAKVVLVSDFIIHITFWQQKKIQFCKIFVWLLFLSPHGQVSLLLTHTVPAIKENIFEKHDFLLNLKSIFWMISWKKWNLELVPLAVFHKFQFNMHPKRMTAFERNYIKMFARWKNNVASVKRFLSETIAS